MCRVVLLATVLFCLAGMAVAAAPPTPMTSASGCAAQPVSYRSGVSPDIAALQAQERSLLAVGDIAGARELEKQVQAILIEQQQVVPHPVPVNVIKPTCTGGSFAPDQLICPGVITASAADYEQDADGTMWAAFATVADSATSIYKSTDHGSNWTSIAQVWWNPKQLVDKIELVVTPGDSGFVYLFEIVPFDNGDVVMARMNKDGTNVLSYAIHYGADTITDFTACRDFSSSYWLYATALKGQQPLNARRSYLLRSTDYGVNWAVTDSIYNLDRPRLAFGPAQYGYLSAVPQPHLFQGQVGTGVTTSWSSPGTWRFVVWQPDTFAISDAAIAPAFSLPPESAVVWIAYTHNNNGTPDWDVLSAYATDTLLNWVGPAVVANTNHVEGYVDLRNYTETGNDYVNLSYADIDLAGSDNAWLGYSSAGAPSVWTPLGSPWVNQSGYISWGLSLFPRIVYSPGGPGSGGGLVFVGMDGNGYFNAPWVTGLAEARPALPQARFSVTPSVARGPVRVSWSGSATRLIVTDVAGRVVRSVAAPAGDLYVWDGKVPAGTYLVRLATSQGAATRPVVIQ